MEGRSAIRIVVPLILIFLGMALLCNNLGIVPGLWDFLVGLWPLLLIAAGLAVILGWRAGWRLPRMGIARSVPFNEPLGDVRSASLELSSRAGELSLDAAGPSSQDLVGGKIPEGSKAAVEASAQSARIRLRHDGLGSWWPFGGTGGVWNLHLNPGVTWTLHVGGGVGDTELDLTDLRVVALRVDGQVGDVKIRLPRRGQTTVEVGGRVGDLTLRVPDGVAARIHRPATMLGSARVNTARFPMVGDIYQSPGFDEAVDWVEIRLDSSVGDLRIA